MPYWLNIDIPLKTATLHTDPISCGTARRATQLKGVGALERDGGWLHFETEQAALAHIARDYGDTYEVVKCDRCY